MSFSSQTAVTVFKSSSLRITKLEPPLGSRYTDLYEASIRDENHTHCQRKVLIKAWRIFNANTADQVSFTRALDAELRNWKRASAHPNVVDFVGLAPNPRVLICGSSSTESERDSIPGLILPYYRNRSAIEHLLAHPKADALTILIGVADALRYMHTLQPPVIHGKIQGSNIMISDDGRPMLTDLGMGRLSKLEGSERWMPPELFDDRPRSLQLSRASDVYSFAMTILELFTRSRPYSNHKQAMRAMMDVCSGIHPPRPVDCGEITDAIWEVLVKCWNKEAGERPDISVVLGVLEIEYLLRGVLSRPD